MKNQYTKGFVRFAILLSATLLLSTTAFGGHLGPHLKRIIEEKGAKHVDGRLATLFTRLVDGVEKAYIHVFIEADKTELPKLKAHDVEINTITSSGIMTAIVPVDKLQSVAALAGVRRIEAAQAVKKMMDISTGPAGVNLPDTAYPRTDHTGAGVIIGVIDTGIDIQHPDFIDGNGETRVLKIWDHTLDDTDVDGAATAPAGFTYGTEWNHTQINEGYDSCAHRDYDGHGTHVAGTAGGNEKNNEDEENGPYYTGIAPEAEFLIVKFDFDNEKNRNTETAILDGINWIFQQAEAEGKPCVINMSLGSDYGPHDGSTAEERGIDDLTGEGKIVCIAAGNAGSSWSGPSFDTHGGPIHGSGLISTEEDIVFNIPGYTETSSDYVFFDIWYPGTTQVYVQVTTPSGVTYPQSYTGPNRKLWYTDGKAGGFATSEGFIYVANVSGANSFWGTENGDNNIYIEISNYYDYGPATGDWIVNIYPYKGGDGTYNSWQGFSDSLKYTFFWYDSGTTDHKPVNLEDPSLADNVMTIGKPASAFSAISVGAYQTKNEWPARIYDDCYDPDSDFSFGWMSYGPSPIDYYNLFILDDLAYFSSRGPTRDDRTAPFISAPGVGIVASYSQTNADIEGYNYYRCMNRVESRGLHTVLQGTSMACPHGTGSVALLLEEATDQGKIQTPTTIKKALQSGAAEDFFTGSEFPNNDWGYGKIDVATSLDRLTEDGDSAPEVTDCSPSYGIRNTTQDTEITGKNFHGGAAVSINSNIIVSDIQVVNETTITCTISIDKRARPGFYDITVTNPDGQSGTLIDGFEVRRR